MDKTKIIAAAVAENKGNSYTTNLVANGHEYIADETAQYGGNDTGASPGEYVCMALASCKAITLRMYANRKQWKVDEIKVKVSMVKGDQMSSGLNTFYCVINLAGEISEEQQKRLLEISKVCPVDRLLRKPGEVLTMIE